MNEYDPIPESAEDDFLPGNEDQKYAALVNALFDTNIGKLRRAVLTPKQSIALVRAWAFASIYDVPELSAIADMLADTTVSKGGKGLNQMVEVMSARLAGDESDAMKTLGRNLGL